MLLRKLISSLERETNFDSALFEGDLHLGHSESSVDLEIGRSCSNLVLHLGQAYSYIGISFTSYKI
jgi:hypothetical protein